MAQAELVADLLRAARPGLDVSLLKIKTKGDKILDVPLAKVGGKGLFVKEIEDALLDGRADLAVHSMKDMPAELPPGLILGAVTEREDVRDVLVSRDGRGIAGLSRGARVGTSSLRRAAQLLAARPDLEIVSIRGNVQTRLKKLDELDLEAVVLAAAGLARLGLEGELPLARLGTEELLPAVGQGALGLEVREADGGLRELIKALEHEPTAFAVAAERAYLARLEGGCQVPIAGYATCAGGQVSFAGLVASLDGKTVVRAKGSAANEDAARLGREIAEQVLDRGGREILAEVYGEAPA